jgi:hypothetical protein
MYVSGGLTIVGGSLTAQNNVIVSGGLSILSGGVNVAGGLTVNSHGGISISGGLYSDATLTVNGNLIVNGGLTIYTPSVAPTAIPSASDSRLKTNIVPIDGALSKISKLKGVYFNWIQDEKNGLLFDNQRHVGVIAQDVEKVLPEVISKIGNGDYLGVDYNGLIPLLIEALNDLND